MKRHNLYIFRCKRGLTQKEMASKTGVSRTTYRYIENCKRDGSHAFWNALQREFSVPDSEMYALMKQQEREKHGESKPTESSS